MKEHANQHDVRNVLLVTAVVSLLLSLSQVLVDNVINSDGVLYVLTASHIQDGDWQSASKLYNWLFYPFLIAQISTITSISLEYSAHLLNGLCTAISCVTFVLIIKEFGAKDKTTLWFASLIILCFPNFNEYRNFIIRDHGYWAFYLLSSYFFIKAYQQLTIKTLTALAFSAVVAALFRVEGIIFVVLLPVIVFVRHFFSRRKTTTALTLTFLIISTLVLMYYFINTTENISGFTKSTQIERAIETPFNKITSSIDITKAYIHKLSPAGFSDDYALTILVITFFLILITEIFSATSPLYAIGLAAALLNKENFQSLSAFRPWIYLILINIIILCGFLISKFFLAGRYPIPLALTLITLLPFLAQSLSLHFKSKNITTFQKRAIILCTTLFIILSIDGLVSTKASNKDHLKIAGEWISASNEGNEKTSIYTNNEFIAYYSDHQSRKRIRNNDFETVLLKVKKGALKDFDFLAIHISRKNIHAESKLLTALSANPIKIFKNKRGDSVLIFKQ
jgi:hypothetical protein